MRADVFTEEAMTRPLFGKRPMSTALRSGV